MTERASKPSVAWNYAKPLMAPLGAIVGLFVIGNFIANGFISINNLSSILMTSALLAIATIAQNTVVIGGSDGIDLSIGASAYLSDASDGYPVATGAGNHSCVADRGVIWQPEWFSHYAHQVVSIGYHTDYVQRHQWRRYGSYTRTTVRTHQRPAKIH